MLTFASFPLEADRKAYEYARHHPDTEEDMLLDELDDEDVTYAKLASPGKPLTSSQAFMQSVFDLTNVGSSFLTFASHQ